MTNDKQGAEQMKCINIGWFNKAGAKRKDKEGKA